MKITNSDRPRVIDFTYMYIIIYMQHVRVVSFSIVLYEPYLTYVLYIIMYSCANSYTSDTTASEIKSKYDINLKTYSLQNFESADNKL